MSTNSNEILVIGGGASGMMAAIAASLSGAKVTLFEKNKVLGKKLLVTGNGRCNLTNMNMNNTFFRSNDSKKVYDYILQFGNEETVTFFNEIGLVTKDKNGYVYPYSEQASSVLEVLILCMERLNVNICLDRGVKSVIPTQDGYDVVSYDKTFHFDKVIMACGSLAGLSDKEINRFGSIGYDMACELDMKLTKLYPSLVPVNCKGFDFKAISGVRSDCAVTVYADDCALSREEGELQITDYGLSGIVIFQLSRYVSIGVNEGKKMRFVVDFLPSMGEDEYDYFVGKRIQNYTNDTVGHMFSGIINSKLTEYFLKINGLADEDIVSGPNIEKIMNVYLSIKQWVVECESTLDMTKAQCCCGGVALSDLDITLQSVNHKGLYLCGEILDVDGKCGGYNLQWAWTSGFIAGRSAAIND